MTYRGQKKVRALPPCPRCGQYSGERRQKEDEDKYIVICTSCGWHTHFYSTKGAATKQWVNEAAKSQEKDG